MSLPLRSLLLAAFAACVLHAAGASASAPQPLVKGNKIVDSTTGKTFIPRGVNFPGFEYACQQGWNYGEDGTQPEQVASTVSAIASWKINTVRLPLNQDCWLGDDGLPSGTLTVSGYRQAVERFTDALNEAGIVVILDLHWSGPQGVVADGLRPMPDARSPAFWKSVATYFKDNRSLIFDLFNEPHSRWNADDTKVFGLTWQCWNSGGCLAPLEADTAFVSGLGWYRTTGLRNLTAVVRRAGATQPILLSGTDYANDLRGWVDHRPKDEQLIAGFHNYLVQRCRTISCWNQEIAPLSEQVPVLAAEIGQNDCGDPGHVKQFMAWADNRSIGYLAWAWWNLPQEGCHNFALVSNLDGTPLPPVGTTLHDHLARVQGPNKPSPSPRVLPRLRLGSARWKPRKLNLRFSISPLASKRIRVGVRLVRDRRSRTRPVTGRRVIQKQLRITSGREKVNLRIPRGLKPRLVIVHYPGDQRFRAQTVRRLPASVSRVTRSSGRD